MDSIFFGGVKLLISRNASCAVLNFMHSHHICIGSSLKLANCLLGTKILGDVQGCECLSFLSEERLPRVGKK